jgi:predicted permease
MPRIPGLRRALRLPGRRAVARDVDEEFALHLDLRERDLVAAGWPPETAHQEALRRFGDVDDARAYCRAMDERRERRTMRLERLASLWHDLALAARALRRAPGFTLAAVLTLALGVGANVAMLGIVDRLLLRPPAHVAAPDALRRLYFTQRDGGESSTDASMSYPQYLALGDGLRPVGPTAAFYDVELVLGEGEAARRGRVTLATASFWPTLGVRPALGRAFTAQEDAAPAGARVAVIGHALWTSAFGGARDVVGRTLVVAGQRFEIVGVAPRGFTGVGPERVDAWVPLAALAQDIVGQYVEDPWHQARNIGWLHGVARLGPAATIPAAEERATAAYRRALEARWGAARADSLRPRAALEPLLVERGPDRTPSARIAVWLAGMSLLVLLIACANVANLLLARALARRRETAVRVALGAGRARIVSQLLAEGMLLATLGGAAALGVAHVGGRLVSDVLVPDMDWSQGVVDARTLALAAATVLVTGLLTAVVPAAQASVVELVPSLRAGVREGGGRRSRVRSALVVVQAALSLVLLVGAGLFVRSLDAARRVELGFAPERVLRVRLDLTGAGMAHEASVALYDRLRDRLAGLPGIAAASVGMTEPFATTIDYRIGIPGRDSLRLPPSGAPRVNAVSPEYLATVGTRLLAGRGFTDGDRRGSAPVMLVNQTMARALWPGRSPMGDRVCISSSRRSRASRWWA